MSELGDLLELLHGAGRFRTARVEFRTWQHASRGMAAFRSQAEGAVMMYAQSEAEGPPPPEESESQARLWLEPPDRARLERDDDHLAVRDGELWWSWRRDWGASTNEGADDEVTTSVGDELLPFLDPAAQIGALEWSPVGRGERNGRAVLRATARPRRALAGDPRDVRWSLHALGAGADEYAIEVDVESGALMRVEARFQGDPFEITEIVDLALDEELPPDTFVFAAPDGEMPAPVEALGSLVNVPLSEVVGSAGFTVFVPARVPADWRLTVHYMPSRTRPPVSETVSLFYRSDDGTASLTLGQSRTGEADDALLDGPGWEDVERDGVAFRLRPRTPDWHQAQLHVERDGTAILMTSDSLSNEDLVELAVSLRPAVGGSPLAD
jgi:outer membrane lipoprotein-sorting protein